MSRLYLKTAPTTEPVTRAEALKHCRIETTSDNSLVDSLITASRRYVEKITKRQLITATWIYYLDEFPEEILIPRPPLISVTSIKYINTSGVETTVSASDYTVDTYSEPARIIPAYGESWPTPRAHINVVYVEYSAGYGAAASVPEELKSAIKLLMGHLYENREATTELNLTELPMAFYSLLMPYRVLRPEILWVDE